MRLVDFDVYKEILHEKSGLHLSQDKASLLESRLNPIAIDWDFPTLEAMTVNLRGVPEPKLIDDIVEAMTTNDSSFFRDVSPFNTFENVVIPYMLKTRAHARKLRIWCNAASSGQEPYSLAMIIYENREQFSRWGIDILGTDISKISLEMAKQGTYSQFEAQRGLPVKMLLKFFTQTKNNWNIIKQLKNMVKFEQFNLLKDMSNYGQFDVIFCRNVLADFDDKTKKDVLHRMSHQLADDGFLFLGKSEKIDDLSDDFAPIPSANGIFAKKNSVHLQKDAQQSAG